jgi:hypothetical protein
LVEPKTNSGLVAGKVEPWLIGVIDVPKGRLSDATECSAPTGGSTQKK